MVKQPSNVNDEDITVAGVQPERSRTDLTTMSFFLNRVKLADICRNIVDSMPSRFLSPGSEDYATVMDADRALRNHIQEVPIFLRLDPESLLQSKKLEAERPDIPISLHRLGIHFTVHSRLCHLHRPFHQKSLTDPAYAYSRTLCLSSAETVLDLREQMDEVQGPVVLKAERSWISMQHVFLAAMSLAMEVAWNPNDPASPNRKGRIFDAYRTLQKSGEASAGFMDEIRKKLHAIMSTMHKQPVDKAENHLQSRADSNQSTWAPQPSNAESGTLNQAGGISQGNGGIGGLASDATVFTGGVKDGVNSMENVMPAMDVSWDQLWSDFFLIAPQMEAPQWDKLWGEMNPQ